MRKFTILSLGLLVAGFQVVISQAAPDWSKFKHLFGEWVGEGNGQPGQGNGSFTFQTDLGGSILVRKSHTGFPATVARPASIHDDLMVVYPDYSGTPVSAIYWDNERHTIEYEVTFTGNAVVFTSLAVETMPRFRLSYETVDDNTVNVKFEMSDTQNPDNFRVYLEGKSRRLLRD